MGIIVLVFLLLPVAGFMVYKKDDLEKYFRGGRAEYQGIITLWNVDGFEGGSASRSSFLERVSRLFEKENIGAFIKVENMTEDEMLANLKAGIYPSLFSFSKGSAGYLKDKMQVLPDLSKSVMTNFYSSGLLGGKLLACPWAAGGYALLTSSERIEAAQKEVGDLRSLAFELAHDISYKKSTKHIYSLTFGAKAINAFSRVFDKGAESLAASGVIDKAYLSQSTYEAYESYALEKAMMLLGTHRDIFRLENRVMMGKESDLIVQPIGEYTDMVCYMSILATDPKIKAVCEDFVRFLVSESMQKDLARIGLLSVSGAKIYSDGNMKLLEDAIDQSTKVENVF